MAALVLAVLVGAEGVHALAPSESVVALEAHYSPALGLAAATRTVAFDGVIAGTVARSGTLAAHVGLVEVEGSGSETGDITRADGTAEFTIEGANELSRVTGQCTGSWSRVGAVAIWFSDCDVEIDSVEDFQGPHPYMWVTVAAPAPSTSPLADWHLAGCAAAHC